MDQHSTIWITSQDAQDIGIRGNEFPCKILDLKTLVYELLKTGSPQDIVVLPFFRNFAEIVGHIRDRNIQGPIIIYTQSEIMQMNLLDYASQGVIFMDSSRFTNHMVIGFITFLHNRQGLVTTRNETGPAPSKSFQKPAHNPEQIRDLFKKFLKRRAKLLLTCQFREDLPTLSVTCEIIKMVGEIETKLVLDNFSPEEFVGLYNQLGKGKTLSGFFSQGEETLGFDLHVDSCRMSKITAFLPEKVFEQKRKYFRVEPDKKEPVTIYIQPGEARTLSIVVRDVSEGGIGMISSYAGLEEGTTYPVALALPKNQIILGNAKVMFKGNLPGQGFNYGLEFIFNHTDLQYLQHYVYKRQAGILAAIRNLTI
ncbi:MAG TPA: PilZ domain-containing protein [Deltaproteobacteria bacterium]|nr:PilZ domain-containing protein [Deltaproteobacteria bacterium]